MYLRVVFCCLKISTIGVLGYNGGMDNNILPTDEYVTFEDRAYLNPNLAVTETNQFIDNLRNTQQANNAQINQQTQSLGTNVPSNLGGLTGAENYWASRYQTPQTNSVVSDLRATAQAAALNQILANEQAMWKKRYNDAYRSYQKSAYNKSNSGGGSGGGSGNSNESGWTGQTKKVSTDDNFIYWLGQDGNVWATKNGVTSNLGAANMVNGQWDGQPSGSTGSMSGNGTKIDDPNPGGTSSGGSSNNGVIPPNVKDYTVDINEKYNNLPEGWRYILETINGVDNTTY